MKKLKQKKPDFNVLKTLCAIDATLDDSKTLYLNLFGADLMTNEEELVFETSNLLTQNSTVESLKKIAAYLNVTPLQATLFSAIYAKYMSGGQREVDMDDLHTYFNVPILSIACLNGEIRELLNANLVIESESRNGAIAYIISPDVFESIFHNQSVKEQTTISISRYEFVQQVSEWINERSHRRIRTREVFNKTIDYEGRLSTIAFVSAVNKMLHKIEDRVLFYEICNDFVSQRMRCTGVDCTLTDLYESIQQRFSVAKELIDGNHILITSDLVQLNPEQMFSEASMSLTDKGKELFLENDIKLFGKQEIKQKNLIYPDAITEKKLFFEENLQKDIGFLQHNLEQATFEQLQKRLSDQGLTQGVAAMFYGSPGTGKTETVYQIAKATGRSIFQIDISRTKSCWFGESEKIIKNLFVEYKKMCDQETVKPILLFNEADAVFSKRKDVSSSNVAQTENAIQNIILEEMEKLNGILLATTNLTENLDAAFERRFLFKIHFGLPTEQAKQAIWKSKLEWLSDEDSLQLACWYNFSGGEIDNIVRKIIMEEILTGNRPSMDFIDHLCANEKLHPQTTSKIGFLK